MAQQVNTQYGSYTACEHTTFPVFSVGKTKIWAGAKREVLLDKQDWELCISLNGRYFADYGQVTLSPLAKERIGDISSIHLAQVVIDWPDGDVIPYGVSWWDRFLKAIVKVEGDIVIACEGGHGRTGTMLTILACLAEVVPADKDPVGWLRDTYCEDVVETRTQINYIQKITGRKIDELPSMFYRKGTQAPLVGKGSASVSNQNQTLTVDNQDIVIFTDPQTGKKTKKIWVKDQWHEIIEVKG